jgi:hypothetical protein
VTGIGIVTYNRKEIVADTIGQVRAYTRCPDAALLVADDGSTDGTTALLETMQVPVVTGVNRGVAWNKNRALFLLSHLLGCQTVILLEDDARPNQPAWENAWIQAARQWGHVNYAAEWMRPHFVAGSGTAADPFQSNRVTAQCAAYSTTALTYAGYFDPHFRGYGHGHVEHTRRLIRAGYGGTDTPVNEQECVLYKMISGGVTVVSSESHFDPDQEERNLRLAMQLIAQQGYRSPWSDDSEMRQFRSEIESAMRGGPARFRLHPQPPAPSPQPVPSQPSQCQPAQNQQPDRLSPLFRPA